MRRRMGRPGLVGTMARTAVVAGTASAVVGASQNRQADKQQAAAEQQAAQQAAPPPAPAAEPAPAAGASLMDELSKLADLKAAGVLTDEEFAAAKAKLLA